MSVRICPRVAALAVALSFGRASALEVDLLVGHPIHHEREAAAGVTMGLAIHHTQGDAARLLELCEELRIASGLSREHPDELQLVTLFVVPYKGMVVEGYYMPGGDSDAKSKLVAGGAVSRTALDAMVARAGVPPGVLDEAAVEHELSCRLDEPVWYLSWTDLRAIGDETPQAVIERARDRFLAVHRQVVGRVIELTPPGQPQRASMDW